MKAAAEELKAARLRPLRRLLHRPLRRPHAGHRRHDGQPALSQRRRHGLAPADPLAADARSGVLGVATCDKGLPAMMMALAGDARSAVRAGPRRRDAAADARARTPARSRSIGARFAHGQITLAGGRRAGLPGLRQPGRRLPVPGHGGHVAGGRRGARPVAAALRPGPVRPADLARHGPPLGPGPGRDWRRARLTTRRHPHRRRGPQRHGRPRGVRRLDQPAAAHPGHRLRRRPAAADGRGLDRDQPPGAAPGRCACPTARSAIRRCASSWPAACPR